MASQANVRIHPSQFPDAVRRDLVNSLRQSEINHKFHYDSIKQAQKWLALHQAFSPFVTDPECALVYAASFREAANRIKTTLVEVTSLGCGGGQKDIQLLEQLKASGKQPSYTPCDVSLPMVLLARESALKKLPGLECSPMVLDLLTTPDWTQALAGDVPLAGEKLFTFLGMLPNFEPRVVLPRLGSALEKHDFLLLSANLAPGADYARGTRKVLPLYDNALTRDWLITFLIDLGIEKRDGEIRFAVEAGEAGLKRIVARFIFGRNCRIAIDEEVFEFHKGNQIRLFFSYRYTPVQVGALFGRYRFEVIDRWINLAGEEGVFLLRKK